MKALQRWLMLLLTGVALSMFGSCSDSEVIGEIGVEAEIVKEMEAGNIPSVAACIIKDGQISWEGAYGYADVATSKPATRYTLYTIQSITKLFIATSVMQLWEEGKIDLEADINSYLPFDVRNPHFPDQKITSLMLLTHTSGLAWPEAPDRIPDFWHFFIPGQEPLISEWLPEYILPGGSAYRPAVWKDYAPGTQELYSNIATSLMALVVEEITGEDFRDYCRKNILEPLEMGHSAFRFENMDETLLATPYYDNNSPMHQFISRHYPAGNLKSNLEDFSHFAIAFLNYGEYKGKRILERSTVEKMFEVHNPATGIALLWRKCTGDCIGKKGGGTGFASWAEWHLDNGRALFLFSNKDNTSVHPPNGRIYELLKYQCLKN